MDRLQAMKVFTRVVEVNSFSKAGDALGLPHATVSAVIKALESHLCVRLLERTTRSLSVTIGGAVYYEQCLKVLNDIEQMESSLVEANLRPHGTIRIEVPASVGKLVILPHLAEFHLRYPAIELIIGLGDREVDLIKEGVDCVVQFGDLVESTLVARRIGMFRKITAASQQYISEHGTPLTLDDLQDHHAVTHFSASTGRPRSMEFVVDGKPIGVRMSGPISVNDNEMYLKSALDGFGIVQLCHFVAHPYIASGHLVEILPQWRPSSVSISAVYTHRANLPSKIRIFVDWLVEIFQRYPLLSEHKERVGDIEMQPGFAAAHSPHAQRSLSAPSMQV